MTLEQNMELIGKTVIINPQSNFDEGEEDYQGEEGVVVNLIDVTFRDSDTFILQVYSDERGEIYVEPHEVRVKC